MRGSPKTGDDFTFFFKALIRFCTFLRLMVTMLQSFDRDLFLQSSTFLPNLEKTTAGMKV